MLSELISKEDCAACRYCCSFKKTSLWEVPSFPADTLKRISKELDDPKIIINKGEKCSFGHFDLSGEYISNADNEEVPCPCLDMEVGCTLSEEYKPFECKLWPFRVMKKDGRTVLAISIACPSIMKWECEWLRSFAQEHLKAPVQEYLKENPYIVKDICEGYLALIEV